MNYLKSLFASFNLCNLWLSLFLICVICGSGCKKNQTPEPNVPWSSTNTKPCTDSGWVDTTYFFSASAEDPEEDNVFCIYSGFISIFQRFKIKIF